MEFFRIKNDIPFMRYRVALNLISVAVFVLAVFFLATRGLHLSIEFTGGTVVEVSSQQAADLEAMRDAIGGLGYTDTQVQNFGSSRDVMIRLPLKDGSHAAATLQSEQVVEALRVVDPTVELRRVEFVGPQIGQELFTDGALALLFMIVGIMIYLALRFEWKFALSIIVANLHDVIIILGFFALFQWEFSLSVLAAVLAVLGYSVNESVVIFDRIREYFRKIRKTDTALIIDKAITSTISRTVITHGSTELVVLSMLIFGGPALHYFALALTIGILFGIYSSVFVASSMALWLGVRPEDLMKKPRDKGERPELP